MLKSFVNYVIMLVIPVLILFSCYTDLETIPEMEREIWNIEDIEIEEVKTVNDLIKLYTSKDKGEMYSKEKTKYNERELKIINKIWKDMIDACEDNDNMRYCINEYFEELLNIKEEE